jgi:hypothetical protein
MDPDETLKAFANPRAFDLQTSDGIGPIEHQYIEAHR